MRIVGGTIDELYFFTEDRLVQLDIKSAKRFARLQLGSGKYVNCTIGKIYVNNMLVLENEKTI